MTKLRQKKLLDEIERMMHSIPKNSRVVVIPPEMLTDDAMMYGDHILMLPIGLSNLEGKHYRDYCGVGTKTDPIEHFLNIFQTGGIFTASIIDMVPFVKMALGRKTEEDAAREREEMAED